MQINSVVNSQIIQRQQNFKGSSANSSPFLEHTEYKPIPLEAAKAYASPQIMEGYKELETFDVPYVGKGKLYELANGHKIIVVPKASKTYISTFVGVGFSDEPADKKDIAHLTEHLLANYWHNASQTSEITKTLKTAGAVANANTNDCLTTYHMSANVQDNSDLESLIKIQLGILTNNNYNDEKIQKDKNIIIEEAKENGHFTKQTNVAYDESIRNLFNLDAKNNLTAEHSIQQIDNIRKEDLEKFYNDFYRPDNMTTIIVGNVDNNSIKTISKYLNKMSNSSTTMQRENVSIINEDKYIKQFKRNDIESQDKSNPYWGLAYLSFIAPKLSNIEDSENIAILNKIIKNRLSQQNLNVDVETLSVSIDKNIPQIITIKSTDYNDKIEKNIETFYSTINDLLKTPVSKNELNKAKKQIIEDLSGKLEENEALSEYLYEKLVSNSKMNVNQSFNRLENVLSKEIQNTAKKYLGLNKASLVVVHPNNDAVRKNAEISFKGLAELQDTKDIKEYDLPNNLHLVIDSRPGIVKTAVSCQFLFENRQENNKGILDAMQTSLVRNENEEFPAGNWVDYEGIHIRKFGSTDNFQTIINDIKKELLNPEFKEDKLEEAKQYQKENLTKGHKKDAFDLLLENNHTIQEQNEVCPANIKTDDLKEYYNSLLCKSQGTIVITIPKEKLKQAEPEIIKSLSEIPMLKPHNFSKIINQFEPKNLDKNYIFLKKHDLSDNVKIEKEFKIVSNENIRDEVGMMLISAILNEKLKDSLRTDLAVSYSPSSYFAKSSPKHGILNISTETSKIPLQQNTKTALIQIDNIINDLTNSKVNQNILNDTKKQIKSNLLIPAETSIGRNIDLESSLRKSYDINYANKLSEILDSITSEDIQKLAQKYLTKPFVLEISGNKDAIEANNDYLSSIGEIVI